MIEELRLLLEFMGGVTEDALPLIYIYMGMTFIKPLLMLSGFLGVIIYVSNLFYKSFSLERYVLSLHKVLNPHDRTSYTSQGDRDAILNRLKDSV